MIPLDKEICQQGVRKMGLLKTSRKILLRTFDFRVDRWLDLETLKKNYSFFWQRTKYLFKADVAKTEETFEDAANRLNLTSEELANQAIRYRYLAFFFLSLVFGFGCYGLFLAYYGNWMGSVISFALGSYALALAFRFHFWNFQISEQKLGCTLEEWYQNNFRKRTRL